MISAEPAIAVLLPCRNSRHLLWRSLASVAAQTLPPAQVLVLDRDSSDGLSDWLRACWPRVERRAVAVDADALAVANALAAAVTAPAGALLRPGECWSRTHLETLVTGSVKDAPGLVPRSALASGTGVADLPWPPEDEPSPSLRALELAIAALPQSAEAILLDLRAAGEPAGMLDLLGLASLVGSTGRRLHALSLADVIWPILESVSPATPLLIGLSGALGLARASEQLCLEEVLRRSASRPVRLVLGGIGHSSPALLSRLLDSVLPYPDLEFWACDAVSARLAMSLIGRGRVRLISPPLLALQPVLAELTAKQLVQPAMLGRPRAGLEPATGFRDHTAWWAGFDPDATRRLGLALARVMGTWRWLSGSLLQQAWFSALVGWAAIRSREDVVRTGDPELAMFAAMCGRTVELVPGDAKQRDLVVTWRTALTELGIATA